MNFSIQPNEIAGFIHFFSSTTPEQKDVWLDKYPELKTTNFENLITLMAENKKKSGPSISDSMLHDFIDKINNLDDLKKVLDGYPGKDIDINKMKQTLDSIWPIYDKFYQEQASKLNSMSDQATQFMNKETVKPLENVAKFYNYKVPQDYTISTYLYPVATAEKDPHQRGGRNRKSGVFIWFSDNLLKKDNPKVPFSTIFHEATHNIFSKSGEADKSLDYETENSPVVHFFETHPEQKHNPKDSAKGSSVWLLNETLTTAFQGIFERDILKQKRESLYANPAINIMAHRMIPVLETALKNGETFGPEFMKKFEKEFEAALPEIEKEITPKQEKSPIMARLSEAANKGKDDPRNQVNATQENTEKKPIFPKWLQNPSWLWHSNKQK